MVVGGRDRHRAGVVMLRGFARDPLPVSAVTATVGLVATALDITGFWVTDLFLAVIVGAGGWVLGAYVSAFWMRRAWMLTTPGGAAVLQLTSTGKIHTFAAWPRGHDTGDQLLHRLTGEADQNGTNLHLSCHHARVPFYERNGFAIIQGRHPWPLLPLRMTRQARTSQTTP